MAEGFAHRMRRMLTGMHRPPEPDPDPGSKSGLGSGAAQPPDLVDAGQPGWDGPRADRQGDEDGHDDPRGERTTRPERQGVVRPLAMRAYPGDYPGVPAMHYAPEPDGLPDPGEVVWTWVPFEEDPALGKDRPVLLIGVDGDWLLGVMLSSRDHEGSLDHEHRAGREWVDVGTGAWDRHGRESEARTDRILRVDPDAVRREGAVLDRERFDLVAAAIRHGG